MEGFRNICFIHADEDSYRTCYLKQFFKWIGFSYFSYIPDSMGVGSEILKKTENRNFDIVVSINHAAQRSDREIADLFGNRFISFEPDHNNSLKMLMGQIYRIVPAVRESRVIGGLVEIYLNYDMADILYEYTTVLLDKSFFDAVYHKYEKVLEALEKLEEKTGVRENMTEYLLYAKFSCQRKMNELYDFSRWIYDYPVKEMLVNIDRIYEYDPGFYRAEYLKAKVAEQDIMVSVRAKSFYYKCIEESTTEVCKSYLYYQLGKWLENSGQIYKALKSYEWSYKCNPASMKAVFKMAIYALRIRDRETEVRYLELLTEQWERHNQNRHLLPLMDLEYAYKAYMLLDDAKRTGIADHTYYKVAQDVLEFTKNMYLEADDSYFIKNLYDEEWMKYICQAMACRMDIGCKYNCLENLNETAYGQQIYTGVQN